MNTNQHRILAKIIKTHIDGQPHLLQASAETFEGVFNHLKSRTNAMYPFTDKELKENIITIIPDFEHIRNEVIKEGR